MCTILHSRSAKEDNGLEGGRETARRAEEKGVGGKEKGKKMDPSCRLQQQGVKVSGEPGAWDWAGLGPSRGGDRD